MILGFSNLNYYVILSLYKPEHLNCSEHHDQTLANPRHSPGLAQPKPIHSEHASLPFPGFPRNLELGYLEDT